MHVKNDTITNILNIKKGFNLSDDIAELQMSTINRLVSNSQKAFRKLEVVVVIGLVGHGSSGASGRAAERGSAVN